MLTPRRCMADQPLRLPAAIRDSLIAHARSGVPDEVCGMLAGHGRQVERIFEVRNAADGIGADRQVFLDRDTGAPIDGQPGRHYYMVPKDQLRIYNAMDDQSLDLVAYYHSHTHTEARPSPTDIRLASDLETYYVLVGLQSPDHPEVRAWRILKDDPLAATGDLREVPVEVS